METISSFEVTPFSDGLINRVKDYATKDHQVTNKVDALGIIYKMLDEVMVEFSRQATCKPGCKWCCDILCEMTPLEAEYIQAHTDHKIDIHPLGKMGYCQFLIDDKCSIYDYRPFNCRAFLSFSDPIYCKEKKPHHTTGGPENQYGSQIVFNLGLQLVMVDTGMVISEAIKPVLEKRIKDIREFFR